MGGLRGRDAAFRGDTGTSYDTTGHLLVVVEGNFELEEPTAGQWTSLEAVLAWASERYEVSPETISGHGDRRHLVPGTESGGRGFTPACLRPTFSV